MPMLQTHIQAGSTFQVDVIPCQRVGEHAAGSLLTSQGRAHAHRQDCAEATETLAGQALGMHIS